MKWLIVFQIFLAQQVMANAPSVVGSWEFFEIRLDGKNQPPFNPDLNIQFEFFDDGTDLLRWWRNNEEGFCERRGEYSFNGSQLIDLVTWVNPDNKYDCGLDPDMQLGHQTDTLANLVGEILETHFEVGDHKLDYLWRRIRRQP